MRQLAETHQTNSRSKRSREYIEDIHGWSEPLGESLVGSLIQVVGLCLKYGKDGVGRTATVNLCGKRMIGKVFSSLLFILFYGLFEDWLKV